MKRFEEFSNADWKQVFFDACTHNWKDNWILDGEKADIINSAMGMDFNAGPTQGDDACHAVLWTMQSFKGDLKIEYEYTRTDSAVKNVNILYIQATGPGQGPYSKDIFQWNHLRTVPYMSTYFNNMNTYHISYAALGDGSDNPEDDYIRARRYMPQAGKGLDGTDLKPEYSKTGLFNTGVAHKITVIKRERELFMHIKNNEKELLCHFKNESLPPVIEGPVGLRHMYTRTARYKDFSVSILVQPG
jgi:hypothetical protein